MICRCSEVHISTNKIHIKRRSLYCIVHFGQLGFIHCIPTINSFKSDHLGILFPKGADHDTHCIPTEAIRIMRVIVRPPQSAIHSACIQLANAALLLDEVEPWCNSVDGLLHCCSGHSLTHSLNTNTKANCCPGGGSLTYSVASSQV